MRLIASLLVLGVTFFSAFALGEAPPTRPGRTPENSLFGASTQTIDNLDVAAGSSISDVLHRLQELDPKFQYVAQPGPWQNAPVPQMRLRGITLQQIVEMVMNVVPDLHVANLSEGGPNPLYVFSGRNRTTSSPANTQWGAFGLADPVERIGLRDAWADLAKDQDAPGSEQIAAGRKKAMKEVLSLLESAVSQADPSFQPTLKLHEETQVLLVRATPAQLSAVSQSLSALGSSVAANTYNANYSHLADQYRAAKNGMNNYKGELDDLAKTNRSLWEQLSKLEKENAALRAQLRATLGKPGADENH